MIRLGLRLTVGAGRPAIIRLVITATAVALGVLMLLLTLASVNAVPRQNDRFTWINAVYATGPPQARASGAAEVDPVWMSLAGDLYDGELIGRVDIATTGRHSPLPPGLTQLPAPGQYYASPAMTALLRSTPADELADRYPGTYAGTIGRAGLPSPDSLLIVQGVKVDVLSHSPNANRVSSFATGDPDGCGCYEAGVDANGIDLILAITAGALLFPVVVFISSATRLSAAEREQRFSAMRLVGATPRQVAVLSSVESTVAAVLGVLAGFGLFFAARPEAAGISLTGNRFFTSDLALTTVDIVVVAVGVPIAAVIAARFALRQTIISPLGVTRRAPRRPPRVSRLIPLGVGILELFYFALVGRPATTGEQILAYLGGVLIVMTGLIVAGPWLTMVAARVICARTGRPAVLLAGRRLADTPHTAFRAISGVILALFVTTVAVAIIDSITANEGAPAHGTYFRTSLVDDFTGPVDPHDLPVLSATLTRRLSSIAGVTSVVAIRSGQRATNPRLGPPAGLISCADLARVPWIGRCTTGARTARVEPDYYQFRPADRHGESRVWPAGPPSTRSLRHLRLQSLIVTTNGGTATIERARTELDVAFPTQPTPPSTLAENLTSHTREIADFQRLADVVMLASLPIAGCSLAVSVSGGLNDRKRPFSLLRLAGAPLGMLRRVIACESVVPLFLGGLLAVASAFLAAELFLESQLGYAVGVPGAAYVGSVLAGLGVSLAIIASTLPLLRRVTGPETARND